MRLGSKGLYEEVHPKGKGLFLLLKWAVLSLDDARLAVFLDLDMEVRASTLRLQPHAPRLQPHAPSAARSCVQVMPRGSTLVRRPTLAPAATEWPACCCANRSGWSLLSLLIGR